jgi:hypothetical protein
MTFSDLEFVTALALLMYKLIVVSSFCYVLLLFVMFCQNLAGKDDDPNSMLG